MKIINVYTKGGEEYAYFPFDDEVTYEPQVGDKVTLAKFDNSSTAPMKDLVSKVKGEVLERRVILERTQHPAGIPSSYKEFLKLVVEPEHLEGEAREAYEEIKDGT